jgi:adenylate cyclase
MGLAIVALGWARPAEWATESLRLRLRERWSPPPHEALLLMAIDDESIKAARQWPFPRPLHGHVLDLLGRDASARPAAVAWDILFVDPSFDPAYDDDMAQRLDATPYPVVLGATTTGDAQKPGLKSQDLPPADLVPLARVSAQPSLATLPDQYGGLLPIPVFLARTQPAFLDANADSDGIVRRLPLLRRVGDEVYPSLVLGSLIAYWQLTPADIEIELGRAVTLRRPAPAPPVRIPVDAQGLFTVNYRYEQAGAHTVMPTLGYYKIYDHLINRFEAEDLSYALPPTGGKLILVGLTATGTSDISASPLRGQSAKVLIHLNALDNILKGDYLRHWPTWPLLGALLALGLGAAWVLDRHGYAAYACVAPALLLVASALVALALLAGNLMIPLAAAAGAYLLQQGAFTTLKIREEQARRARIRGMFATYVAPALVDQMIKSGEEPKLGGVEAVITQYFSDIEAFSSFSEKLSPPQLVELMNEYLTACSDIVKAEGGTVDKYIGDAVVAIFGAPLTLPGHGHRAAVAALRVHRRCAELRAKWRHEAETGAKPWPDIVLNMRTRIGLNHGPAVVGNMGSQDRFNYTMMGDNVNLAARMESGAKSYGVYTMVTEAVVIACRAEQPDAVLFRPLDKIIVKGRSLPVSIYEAVALGEDITDNLRACVAHYEQGLARYYAQDWVGARGHFHRSIDLEAHAKNNPSRVMLERIQILETSAPFGTAWDGVWRMTSK